MTKNKSKAQNQNAKTKPGLALILLLALLVMLPLLTHAGLPNTADGPAHLMRQAELNQAWQDGVYYPRWAPDLAFGYGMPLFSYAPPLLYYTSQAWRLTGLPLDEAMKASLILAILLYGFGMYLFSRAVFGPQAALLSATVYLLAPYRLRELYIQGNYGQFWGLAFYPLIFWSFHRLIVSNQRRYIIYGTLSLAGLLLSHNISAMLFAPLFGFYLLLMFWLYRPQPFAFKSLIKQSPWPLLILSIALGLALSAFFWLPAFAEQDFIRLSGITSGFFDFRHNFIAFADLVALPQALDLSSVNPYFPFSLGTAQLILAIVGVAVLLLYGLRSLLHKQQPLKKGQQHTVIIIIYFALALLGYAFMTLPASTILWETLPLVALTEFPWRMLGPALFCAAVLSGGGIYLLQQINRRAAFIALALGLTLGIAFNLVYLVPDQFISWGTPTPADTLAYEKDSGAIGTTSTGEFLPAWANRYPVYETLGPDYEAGRLPTKIDPALLPPGASAETVQYTARQTRLNIDTPAPFLATLRTLYWPEWKVSLISNGVVEKTYAKSEIEITQPEGLLQISLPAGKYALVLERADTPIRQLSAIISLVSAIILLVLLFLLFRQKQSFKKEPPTAQTALANFSIWQIGLLSGILGLGLILSGPFAKQFRVQSPPDAVHNVERPLKVDFEDQLRLLGLDEPDTVARAGSTITPVAYWRALKELDSDYAVFLHLDGPNGETLATTDQAHPSNIPTSHWHPTLYLRNPLPLTIPANAPPIRYSLRLGLYNSQTGQRLARADGQGDTFEIGYIWVEAPVKAPPNSQIGASFAQNIKLLNGVYNPAEQSLSLYWQTKAPLNEDYSIFIHLLDENGLILGQLDGLPYNNQYPTSAWRKEQIIEDKRWLNQTVEDPTQVKQIAVGVYNPLTGQRLIATDKDGNSLEDNAVRIQP